MNALVFAQRDEARVDLAGIVANAGRWFGASIEVLEEQGYDPAGPAPSQTRVRLALERAKDGLKARFWLVARKVDAADLERARAAELRGRAAGMAGLAERCRTLWEIHPEADASELALLVLSAVLAATALGPVLPADGSTLYGVRGAMERAGRLQKA